MTAPIKRNRCLHNLCTAIESLTGIEMEIAPDALCGIRKTLGSIQPKRDYSYQEQRMGEVLLAVQCGSIERRVLEQVWHEVEDVFIYRPNEPRLTTFALAFKEGTAWKVMVPLSYIDDRRYIGQGIEWAAVVSLSAFASIVLSSVANICKSGAGPS